MERCKSHWAFWFDKDNPCPACVEEKSADYLQSNNEK